MLHRTRAGFDPLDALPPGLLMWASLYTAVLCVYGGLLAYYTQR